MEEGMIAVGACYQRVDTWLTFIPGGGWERVMRSSGLGVGGCEVHCIAFAIFAVYFVI
jgi:hypothetical protein